MFDKYRDIWLVGMPILEDLSIDTGNFSFQTLNVFRPLKTIDLSAVVNPSADDLFDESRVTKLESLDLSKLNVEDNKMRGLLLQLGKANKLKHLKIIFNKKSNTYHYIPRFIDSAKSLKVLELLQIREFT